MLDDDVSPVGKVSDVGERGCPRAEAARAPHLHPQAGYREGEGSLPFGTDLIARSFLVASSPLLGPRSTDCGRLDGG